MINNTGYSVFATKCVTDAAHELQSVNYSDYKKWCKQYTFNALKTGHRFGQDFCMYFDITDYILYYTNDPDRANTHIKKYYVKWKLY